MASVRIEINADGVRELLRSQEVRDDLQRRAERIAAQAGEGYEADSSLSPKRARANVRTVTPEAMRDEAINHTLERALDAGR